MTITQGKITEATEAELFEYYLKTGYDDILPFDEYANKCIHQGTKITERKKLK